ncbi:class I SAM-dependent methyltransferase [Egicoccus sp. AB-alg2]|uniref:class I SAM-dependent methyltransferase n=1 Tax=Egicoccus sp. AB-alg2 TaxID=3242693 RepID=UPI00359E5D32
MASSSAGAPDANARGWDVLADAYQREVGWPDDALTWGLRCPPEEDLRLVTDLVTGATTVVVGCGGGQDLLALARMGAGRLVGVDPSARQLAHARRRLDEAGVEATLVRADAEALHEVPDGAADLVVSVQALNYLEDVDGGMAEAWRVLRPGGHLVFSVMHPADAVTDDAPPYGFRRSWFEVASDWVWDGLAEEDVAFRSWFRSASDWFTACRRAGFDVERLLEPAPADDRRWIERGWLDEDGYAKLDRVPATIAVRARRPVDGAGPT